MTLTAFTVQTEAELSAVWKLTMDVYEAEGYLGETDRGRALASHAYFDMTPETEVYAVADEAGKILATCSATVDGPRGLHTDRTFPDETDEVREECFYAGKRLGSSWRIATSPICRGKREPVILVMDRTLKQFSKRIDTWLCTFHPNHERMYSHWFSFEKIAGPKPDMTVNGAPAILMRGESPLMLRTWASGPGRRL